MMLLANNLIIINSTNNLWTHFSLFVKNIKGVNIQSNFLFKCLFQFLDLKWYRNAIKLLHVINFSSLDLFCHSKDNIDWTTFNLTSEKM